MPAVERRFDPMTYAEFWPRYLAAHADRRTRALHYLGTRGALALHRGGRDTRDWRWLIAAPVVGYAPGLARRMSFSSATGRKPLPIRSGRC